MLKQKKTTASARNTRRKKWPISLVVPPASLTPNKVITKASKKKTNAARIIRVSFISWALLYSFTSDIMSDAASYLSKVDTRHERRLI